jgi:hypothetical protein
MYKLAHDAPAGAAPQQEAQPQLDEIDRLFRGG